MDKKKVANLLERLANVASQGRYTVDPAGARRMNALFEEVAVTINELEKEDNNDSSV